MVPAMNVTHTQDACAQFLERAGWGGAKLRPLAGDASTRSYMRAEHNRRHAVLMIAPPKAESAPCPPEASDAERRALGYNAMARLAGPNLNAFIAIAEALRSAGLSAPEVFTADAANGFALIEDLGDGLYARAANPANEAELYRSAIDALAMLRQNPPKRPAHDNYAMASYDAMALCTEADLLIEWYWPLKKSTSAPESLQAEYREIFQNLASALSPPHQIVLRDYHAENLLWLPQRKAAARTGVIDFQDGLYGHAAYDVVSLLEDARRDVSPALAAAVIDHYAHAADIDQAAFINDYAILAAQRNAKILGIFARLARRDNKPHYLDFLPRVEAHFRNDLKREGMAPLREFITAHLPELAP